MIRCYTTTEHVLVPLLNQSPHRANGR